MTFEDIVRQKIAATQSQVAKTVLKVALGDFQQKNSSGAATFTDANNICQKIVNGNKETLSFMIKNNFILKVQYPSSIQNVRDELDKAKVNYHIVEAGVGPITVNDVKLADGYGARFKTVPCLCSIYSLGVTCEDDALKLANELGVVVVEYGQDFLQMLIHDLTEKSTVDDRIIALREEIQVISDVQKEIDSFLPKYLVKEEVLSKVMGQTDLLGDIMACKNAGQATGLAVKWFKAQNLDAKGEVVKEVITKLYNTPKGEPGQ